MHHRNRKDFRHQVASMTPIIPPPPAWMTSPATREIVAEIGREVGPQLVALGQALAASINAGDFNDHPAMRRLGLSGSRPGGGRRKPSSC